MLSKNKFHSPMDALELHKKGVIKLGKTLMKDYAGRTYRMIRFEYHCGEFVMWLEFPNGNHEKVGKKDIANMKLELVPEKGTQVVDWEDPA